MDFRTIYYTAASIPADTGLDDLGWSWIYPVQSPCTIRYFDAPNGNLVKQIEKDTEIYVQMTGCDWSAPCANVTYPTYHAGWRYAAPFLEVRAETETPKSGAELAALSGDRYYVRLADVTAVVEAGCRQIPNMAALYTGGPEEYPYLHSRVRLRVLLIDRLMYSSGYYVSPDIYHEPWDGWTVGLLAAGGVLLAADGALVLRGRKGR